MKKWIHAKEEVEDKVELDPKGRKVVDKFTIIFNYVISDNKLAASNQIDWFPGRAKFKHDVEDILTNELGCTVSFSQESNRPESVSISIYFVVYFPIDDTHSIQCSIFLKVSDHVGDELNSEEQREFLKRVKSYKHASSGRLYDEVINLSQKIYQNYSEALDDFRDQMKQLMYSRKKAEIKLLQRKNC